MCYTAEEALQKVKEYVTGSTFFKDGTPVTHIVVVPDIEDIGPIISMYLKGEIDSQTVAKRYGNGRNLLLYSLHIPI